MRETDLRAFEIAIGVAEPGGVMCSYNRVNGDFACENNYLLNEVLKKDFHFKGFVLSDWGGTHSAIKASHAGLDQEQPDKIFLETELKKAIESGSLAGRTERPRPSRRAHDLRERPLRSSSCEAGSGRREGQ